MLNEIEFFVSLLDDNDADKLLKFFNQNVKADNLQFKKVKLLMVYRGTNNKRKKGSKSPFEFTIDSLIKQEYEGSSEIDLFDTFNRDIENKIPDYIKFSNALYYYPEKTKELLELLDDNHKHGRQLFKGAISFQNDEEVEKYYLECTQVPNMKNAIIKQIKGFLNEEEKELKELEENVREWSLVDYYNNFYDEMKNHKAYLIQLAYLNTHQFNEDVEKGISLDMILNYNDYLHSKKRSKECDNETNEMIMKIKEINETTEELKNDIQNKKEENKQLVKQIATLSKENKANKNKINKYEEVFQKEKEENKKLTERLEKLVNDINTLKEISNEDSLIKNENKKLKKEIKELSDKIKYFDDYLEYACEVTEDGENEYLFSFIVSSEHKFCRKLFPEVLFIDAEKINEEFIRDNFKKIKTIYIQRNGMSNSKINLIQKIAKQNNIIAKLVMLKNEKEIIEEIIKVKYMEGE